MNFVSSADGLRIAYEVAGGPGPALLLLHGFSNDRRMWHEAGLVARLGTHFRVVAIDLRGCGESDAPPDPARYGVALHLADVAAVADAVGAERFLVWGWSFGATIGLHLAARSPRLVGAVIAGTVFGRVYPEDQSRAVIAEVEALAEAQAQGRLDAYPPAQRAFAERTNIPVWLAQQRGFATWVGVEPAEVRAPLLVYTGTADEPVVSRLEGQRAAMAAAGIPLHVFADLDYRQLVTAVDVVLPPILAFLQRLGPDGPTPGA